MHTRQIYPVTDDEFANGIQGNHPALRLSEDALATVLTTWTERARTLIAQGLGRNPTFTYRRGVDAEQAWRLVSALMGAPAVHAEPAILGYQLQYLFEHLEPDTASYEDIPALTA